MRHKRLLNHLVNTIKDLLAEFHPSVERELESFKKTSDYQNPTLL